LRRALAIDVVSWCASGHSRVAQRTKPIYAIVLLRTKATFGLVFEVVEAANIAPEIARLILNTIGKLHLQVIFKPVRNCRVALQGAAQHGSNGNSDDDDNVGFSLAVSAPGRRRGAMRPRRRPACRKFALISKWGRAYAKGCEAVAGKLLPSRSIVVALAVLAGLRRLSV
jgi:hypothetical protein